MFSCVAISWLSFLGFFFGGIPAVFFIAFKKRKAMGIASIIICGAIGIFFNLIVIIIAAIVLTIIALVIPEANPSDDEAKEIMYDLKKQEEQKTVNLNAEPKENEWKCPDCGKINNNYVGTCGCGRRKQ